MQHLFFLPQLLFQEMTLAGNKKIAGFDLFSSKAVVKSYPFTNLFHVNKDKNKAQQIFLAHKTIYFSQ